jgi:hypothetical protein
MPGLTLPLVLFTLIYVFLAAVVSLLLVRQFRASPRFVGAA